MSRSRFVLSSAVVAAFFLTTDSVRAQSTSSPALNGLEGLLTPPLVAAPGQPTLSSAATVPGVLNSDGTINPAGGSSQALGILDDEDDPKKRRGLGGGRRGGRRGGGGGGGGSHKPTTTHNAHQTPSTSTKHTTGNQPAHSGQSAGTTKQSPPIVKYRPPGTLKSSTKHGQHSARITPKHNASISPKHNASIGRPSVGRAPLAKQVARSHQASRHAGGGHHSATSAAMAARHGKGAAGSRHHAGAAPAHHHGGGGGHHGGGGGHHGGGGGGHGGGGGAGGGGGGH